MKKLEPTIFSAMSALAMEHQAINFGQGFTDFSADSNYFSLHLLWVMLITNMHR